MFKAIELNVDEKTVYKNSRFQYNREGRLSVNECGETNELIITGVKPEDAGEYSCIASTEQYTAQLVVLGKSKYNASRIFTRKTVESI